MKILTWTKKWPATREEFVTIFEIMTHQLTVLPIEEVIDL